MQKTLENLAKAYIGESQARNRYTSYAKIAKKEGYEQISALFLETADNEREHAAQLIKMIGEIKKTNNLPPDEIKVEAEMPFNVLSDTLDNLQAAATGEKYECSTMYPEFAQTAEADGLPAVASRLLAIAAAEKHHEERYQKLIVQLRSNSLFVKEQEVQWVCRECGYIHKGKTPPVKCPSCDHEQGYYQLLSENY
ncbi:MAG: rubrerythrin [Patescibacteria group bacterium]